MKAKDLQAKRLTQRQIDYIIMEYGRGIDRVKQERGTYETQLSTTQAVLKSSEGMSISELQGKIQTPTMNPANKDAECQKQPVERGFNGLLKTAVEGFRPRDLKAIMPFLDVERLKVGKDREADIRTALGAVKKDGAYLFQDVSIPHIVVLTPDPGGDKTDDTRTQANNALRSILGGEQEVIQYGCKYYRQD